MGFQGRPLRKYAVFCILPWHTFFDVLYYWHIVYLLYKYIMRQYRQLSIEERNTIYSLNVEGFSKREIAMQLNRSPSTITREIQRNSSLISHSLNHIREELKTSNLYHYLPDTAQTKRDKRRKEANYRPPLKNPQTFKYVLEKLKQKWSPDIIAWTLKEKYKYSCKYTISPETIYRFIYTKHWRELNLIQYLLRKHKRRKPKTGKTINPKSKIPNRIDISERKKYFPKLETRKEFGHFEWDSILSVRTTYSAIHTEVERKTRYIFAEKLNKKSAENVQFATIKIFQNLQNTTNPKLVKSTTWDNWTEHANHENITRQTSIKIFFAEPYKSWQRGTNEHANGMIRRYFPKWTNFDEVTNEQLQEVVYEINNRPRKILNYKTPQEVFNEEIEKLQKQTE